MQEGYGRGTGGVANGQKEVRGAAAQQLRTERGLLRPAGEMLNQADEAYDGAEGADVVLGEGEWFVTLVFGDA